MNIFNNLSQKLSKKSLSFEDYLQKAQERCVELNLESITISDCDHNYSMKDAQEELGLDDDLIDSLIEDFVVQIISNISLFKKYLNQSKETQDLTIFRELAHKNLGVARNLRIKDMQKILKEMMGKDDPEEILKYIDYLEACAIILKPETAYEAYKKR